MSCMTSLSSRMLPEHPALGFEVLGRQAVAQTRQIRPWDRAQARWDCRCRDW